LRQIFFAAAAFSGFKPNAEFFEQESKHGVLQGLRLNPRQFGSGISLERVNPNYSEGSLHVLVKCLNTVHSVSEWCVHRRDTSDCFNEGFSL
jgi:hypothetical protein